MIGRIIKNKSLITPLILLGLILYIISTNMGYQRLVFENEQRQYRQGGKVMNAILSDFSLFSSSFISGAYTHNFHYPSSPIDSFERYESIRLVQQQAESLDLHSFNYLYQSMLNVYELYYKELITIEELEYIVMSLNRDVKGLANLYIRYASEKSMYEKAYGLDPDFYKKEKEFMDKCIKKYNNINVEDIK